MDPIISPLDAIVLGVVEGLTEFLPVSSTGHLILAGRWLGIEHSDGAKAFEIVIQAGALAAVLGLYRKSVGSMARGVAGRDPAGLRLLLQLVVAFLPAAFVGLLAGDWIKDTLFGIWPVVAALAVGGALMIAVERWRVRGPGHEAVNPESRAAGGLDLSRMTLAAALVIGAAQCLAMWPGTSRSMVTIVAALLLGFSPRAAAEFSFLLALPTLGAATAYDFLKNHEALVAAAGPVGLGLGFLFSMIVAWLAVKGFLAYLTRHGMSVFGWYRIALAIVVAVAMMNF